MTNKELFTECQRLQPNWLWDLGTKNVRGHFGPFCVYVSTKARRFYATPRAYINGKLYEISNNELRLLLVEVVETIAEHFDKLAAETRAALD